MRLDTPETLNLPHPTARRMWGCDSAAAHRQNFPTVLQPQQPLPPPGLQDLATPKHPTSHNTPNMATVLPPPSKRQRREDIERTQTQQDVAPLLATDLGSFKANFVDGDGNQLADVIEINFADATEKNVSTLLNTLLERVCAPVTLVAVL